MPSDVRHYFNNKVTFSKSLETINFARAEAIMQECKDLIAAARKKDNGEIVDIQEAVKAAEAKIASFSEP